MGRHGVTGPAAASRGSGRTIPTGPEPEQIQSNFKESFLKLTTLSLERVA